MQTERVETPADFFFVGGTMHRDSRSYVTRPADNELLNRILSGQFCYVLTPRQMGKSSLVVRTAQRLHDAGAKTATIDLQGIGTEGITIDLWYQNLLDIIQEKLELSVDAASTPTASPVTTPDTGFISPISPVSTNQNIVPQTLSAHTPTSSTGVTSTETPSATVTPTPVKVVSEFASTSQIRDAVRELIDSNPDLVSYLLNVSTQEFSNLRSFGLVPTSPVIDRIEVFLDGNLLNVDQLPSLTPGQVVELEIIAIDMEGRKYLSDDLRCSWAVAPLGSEDVGIETNLCKALHTPSQVHSRQTLSVEIQGIEQQFEPIDPLVMQFNIINETALTDTTEALTEQDSNPITLVFNAPPSVASNESFNVDVVAKKVPLRGLYGIQFEINYDSTLISVSNLQVNPNLSFIILNSADNTTGKIKLVASQQGKVPGLTGDITLLSFDATAADISGIASFTFWNEKISDSRAQGFNIVSEEYPIAIGETVAPEPTGTPALEPTKEPTPETIDTPAPELTDEPIPEPADESTMVKVSGQVILPGRANDNWSGARVVIDDTGQASTTDATGYFSIPDPAGGLLGSITADAHGYLSADCTGVTVTTSEIILSPIGLLSGDINDDDLVDITNATAVGTAFGQTGLDLPTDITRDGVVDIFDTVLVSVNFGESGPKIWGCLER